MSGFAPHGTYPHAVLPPQFSSIGGTTMLRYSTHGYTSRGSDTPAYEHYDGLIVEGLRFEQGIELGLRSNRRVALGLGDIALWNGDRSLDALFNSYTIDGRAVTIKSAAAAGARIGNWPALSGFVTDFAGSAAGWRRDARTIRVRLRDILTRLDVPLQSSLYAGTGGTEGGADLKGRPKPWAWGYCFNVAPVFLGIIDLGHGPLYSFQASWRQVRAIPIARIRGAEQVLVAGAPGLGQYTIIDLATGVFQLGSSPDGPVTCDVEGDAAPFFIASTARIVRRMVLDIAGLTGAIDETAFDLVDYLVPDDIGVYIGPEPVLLRDVIEALLAAAGGFATQNRLGQFRVGVMTAPEATANFTLAADDILECAPVDLPADLVLPPRLFRVGWKRNWFPMADLPPGLDADKRAELATTYRVASAFNAFVAANYLLSPEAPSVESFFALEAGGTAHAERLKELFNPSARPLRVLTRRYRSKIELGMTGSLTYPDHGLEGGWRGVVYRLAEDRLAGLVELLMFG
jgi:hypothetical protein